MTSTLTRDQVEALLRTEVDDTDDYCGPQIVSNESVIGCVVLRHWAAKALCDLAKLALSPPQDVAGLVSELRGLIEKATNEPWEQAGEFVSAKKLHGSVTEMINVATCDRPEDAAYLVSAQPANMTKLLDCVTSLSARNRGLEAGVRRIIALNDNPKTFNADIDRAADALLELPRPPAQGDGR